MKPRAWLSLLCGAACSAACVVKSFDVDSAPVAGGGTSTAGSDTNSGDSAGIDSGGTSSGGSSTMTGGAQNMTRGGETSAAGANEGGEGGASIGGAAPYRVGYSEFHDSANGSDNASSHLADASFDKPAGTTPGDLMLVFFGCDHELVNVNAASLDQIGWTLLDQHEQVGTDGQGSYLLYRFADGTEPDPIVFKGINNTPSGNGVQGLLSVYRGVHPTKPINAYEPSIVKEGADTSKHVDTATPEITTLTNNCLLIAGLSPDTAVDAPVVATWPDGFDDNHTSVINPKTPYPFGWANIYTAERALARAGTVPASRFGWDMTYDGTAYYGSYSFVLALAPAP